MITECSNWPQSHREHGENTKRIQCVLLICSVSSVSLWPILLRAFFAANRQRPRDTIPAAMNVNWLLLSMVYSTVGLGMFLYGKKAVRIIPLLAGIALMIVPYFLSSPLWMSVVCVILMALPILMRGRMEM
jgi:hypothetical protein